MPIRTRTPVRPPKRLTGMRAVTWFYFAAVTLAAVVAVCLWRSGTWLVHTDPLPAHVRWAAVLAGEGRDMERSEAAFRLFQDGRFDSLILSGPRTFKTHYESEFSSQLLRAKGFPRDRLFTLPNEATSTAEEAEVLIKQARLLGIDTLLLITSEYHTARARRIYRRFAGGSPVVFVYGAETPDFDPQAWWTSRTSKEIWTIEWVKTLNSDWELLGKKPLRGAAEYVLLDPNPVQGGDAGALGQYLNEESAAARSDTVVADSGRSVTPVPDSAARPDSLRDSSQTVSSGAKTAGTDSSTVVGNAAEKGAPAGGHKAGGKTKSKGGKSAAKSKKKN